MSNLLDSGIINILVLHDVIVEARIKAHELSNQARIEALENWVLKQDKNIEEMNDKLSRMDVNG